MGSYTSFSLNINIWSRMHRAFYSLAGSVNPGHKKEEEKKTIKEVFFFLVRTIKEVGKGKIEIFGGWMDRIQLQNEKICAN